MTIITKEITEEEQTYLDRLDAYLIDIDAPDDRMMLPQLYGFLTGVVVSPDMIMPQEWLPCIWGEEESAPFEDETQAQAILNTVMQLYNDILASLDAHDYAPIFDYDTDDTPLWEFWIDGFWKAVELRSHSWQELEKNPKAALAHHAFDTLKHLYALSQRSYQRSELTKEEESLFNNAADLIIISAQQLYTHRISQQNIPATSSKVGRNEKCPCGSGKKHKKCCL